MTIATSSFERSLGSYCRDKERKISQEQVARAAGMARPDVSRFESGKYNPSLELMNLIEQE